MASWQAHFWSFFLRHTFKRKLARAVNVEQVRAVMDGSIFRTPADVEVSAATLGGVRGEWVEAPQSKRILLYLHGGGYVACSPRTHRPYTTAFARLGFRVFAPDYRLAPEHRFPAGLDDAVAVCRALRLAYPDEPLVIAGDSAGGGLALATLLRLRDSGDALPPVAAVLFSPLTDLTGSGNSRSRNDQRCAMFHRKNLDLVPAYYLDGATPANDPLASPLFAEPSGLPPLLIHAGADETLLDDSTQFAERAKRAGVEVELEIWPVVSHVWQLLPMPEARQSMRQAAAFLHRQILKRG